MIINRIRVDGFANLNDVTLKLDQLTYLLSRNNYGKSNVMKAIDLASSILNGGGSFNKGMNYDRFAPLCEADYRRPFLFEIGGNSKLNGKDIEFSYSFSFDWGEVKEKEPTHPFFLSESLEVRFLDSQKSSSFFTRNKDKGLFRKKASGRTDTETPIDESTLLLYKLTFVDEIDYRELLQEILQLQVYVDAGLNASPFLGLDSLYPHLGILNAQISVIPSALNIVNQSSHDSYLEIVNTMKDLFPSTTDFFLSHVDNPNPSPNQQKGATIFFLSIGQKHIKAPLDISLMSDGFKRVLNALICLTMAKEGSSKIVCLEEPENCINPSLLKNYLRSIEAFAGNNRILISSHSPFLASYIKPEQLYVGLPEEDGMATFKPFKETGAQRLAKAASDNDFLFGEYVFNLLAGDDTDLKFLKKALVD
jgi:predicted ATPase